MCNERNISLLCHATLAKWQNYLLLIINIKVKNSSIGWKSHIFEFWTEPFWEFSAMVYCTIVVQTWSESPNTGEYKVKFIKFFRWIIGRDVLGYDHAFKESAESLNVTDVWNWGDFLEPVILKVVIICNFLTVCKFNLASFLWKIGLCY